jgi:hypothetical protein
MISYDSLFIDYVVLPLCSIKIVYILTNTNYNFMYTLYENNYIIIDYWFYIHVINSNLLILLYPYKLDLYKYWYFILSWEIIENIIIPNLFKELYYYKEEPRDSFGDIVAAIPGSIYLTYINKNK